MQVCLQDCFNRRLDLKKNAGVATQPHVETSQSLINSDICLIFSDSHPLFSDSDA